MKMELHATPEEVMRAVEALQKYAATHGVPERTSFDLALALEECGSNIVNHALERKRDRTFLVFFERANDLFLIELRDTGPAFDPTTEPPKRAQAEDPDLPGGWGIDLVRRHVDEIRYERDSGENILRLVKKLRPTADKEQI